MRIDGFRFKDLSPMGLVFLAAGFLIGAWAIGDVVQKVLAGAPAGEVVGGLGVAFIGFLLFAWFAYETASPEYDVECDACGAPIRVNSGTDRRDGVLEARQTKPPHRLELGSLSMVLARRKREYVFCSVGCAERDAPQECIEHVGVADPPRDDPLDPLLDADDAASEEVADD